MGISVKQIRFSHWLLIQFRDVLPTLLMTMCSGRCQDCSFSYHQHKSGRISDSSISSSHNILFFFFFFSGCNRCEQQGNNFYVSSRINLSLQKPFQLRHWFSNSFCQVSIMCIAKYCEYIGIYPTKMYMLWEVTSLNSFTMKKKSI